MFFYDLLPDWLFNAIFPVVRWLHIIGSTLLIGGTLFYEFVVPIAIEDLKPEQQASVFARVRWVFSKVVWTSLVLLMVSGVLASVQYKNSYDLDYPESRPWWIAHVALGMLTLAAGLRLTISKRIPPVSWLRVNLALLLVVVFLANTARHVRISIREKQLRDQKEEHLKRQVTYLPTTRTIKPPTTQPNE